MTHAQPQCDCCHCRGTRLTVYFCDRFDFLDYQKIRPVIDACIAGGATFDEIKFIADSCNTEEQLLYVLSGLAHFGGNNGAAQ